jgi:hypothetical protein
MKGRVAYRGFQEPWNCRLARGVERLGTATFLTPVNGAGDGMEPTVATPLSVFFAASSEAFFFAAASPAVFLFAAASSVAFFVAASSVAFSSQPLPRRPSSSQPPPWRPSSSPLLRWPSFFCRLFYGLLCCGRIYSLFCCSSPFCHRRVARSRPTTRPPGHHCPCRC